MSRSVPPHTADGVRQAFAAMLPEAALTLLYDVSQNTCKLESHVCNGTAKRPAPSQKKLRGPTRTSGRRRRR